MKVEVAVVVGDDEDVTVDDVKDETDADDVVDVDVCAEARRFSVIVPGPENVTAMGLLEPEQVNPPEQLQEEIV